MSFRAYDMKTFLVYPEFALNLACFESFFWSENQYLHKSTTWYRLKRLIYIIITIILLVHICAVTASAFVPRVTPEAEAYSPSDSKLFEVLAIVSYFCCSFYKMWNIFWRRDDICRVMEELKALFPSIAKQKRLAELNESKEGKIGSGGIYRLEYYEEKSRTIMQFITRYFMFAYVAYNSIPVMQLCFAVITQHEHITYRAQANAWYPWHNHNDHSSFLGFMLSYLTQAIVEYTSITFVMSGEFLFCFFTTQMLMHYNYLCSALSALDASAPDAVRQLKALISYHTHLLRLSKLINSIFNLTFALDLIITTFAISLMGLAIVLVNFADALMFSAGFSFFLLLGYLFCNNGDEILRETMQINSAIFYSNWYEGSPEYRRLIIFFIMRTKTPCQYQAYGYTPLSMETYMRILKLSYQMFTSVRAIE
ncbi:putative odorant receptor 69a [Zeugodacus cucurbitae]|uniref:putative odorant receptor 69a n=1 Tax=Zeugodacus cucurbitae TaxID=28588 RepID=UPI0023D92519|nr:putative odorant receptor 69a [Zeugodacus cucurbitae]